jgi:hypothetical protein
MSEYVNYNSVVIDLEPNANANTNVRVASFDQAFLGEEFSEARGKGRARRKSRKLERISNRREVRTERRKLKGDKQEERIARRKTRKSARQDIRGEQQDARMERRNKRREDKESRNGGSETDSEEEEDTATQQGGGRDQGSEDSQDTGSTGSGSGDSQDTGSTGGGYDDSEDTQTQSGSGSDDGSYEDEEDDSESPYDEAEENFAGDGSEFAFEVTGKPSVPNAIQTICYKIEMNNEMISQLMQHKKMLEAKQKDVSKINNTLGDKYQQNQVLESKLENFAGADGKVDRAKAKAVKIAKRKARAKRIENLPIPPVVLYKLLKKGISKDKIKTWWETKGRKQQASKMNFEGGNDEFGMSSEPTDYMDYSEFGTPAYDYEPNTPEVINMDSQSNEPVMNFSGSTSNTYWRSLLIGGVIAFAGVYIIRKYKLLK